MSEPLIDPLQEDLMRNILLDITKEFQERIKYNRLPDHLSLHITPDMSYVSLEHEIDYEQDILIRKSPACHQILLKL